MGAQRQEKFPLGRLWKASWRRCFSSGSRKIRTFQAKMGMGEDQNWSWGGCVCVCKRERLSNPPISSLPCCLGDKGGNICKHWAFNKYLLSTLHALACHRGYRKKQNRNIPFLYNLVHSRHLINGSQKHRFNKYGESTVYMSLVSWDPLDNTEFLKNVKRFWKPQNQDSIKC